VFKYITMMFAFLICGTFTMSVDAKLATFDAGISTAWASDDDHSDDDHRDYEDDDTDRDHDGEDDHEGDRVGHCDCTLAPESSSSDYDETDDDHDGHSDSHDTDGDGEPDRTDDDDDNDGIDDAHDSDDDNDGVDDEHDTDDAGESCSCTDGSSGEWVERVVAPGLGIKTYREVLGQ